MADDGLGQFRRKLVYSPRIPAEPYVKALKKLHTDRGESGREDEWKDITRFITPRKGMYYTSGDYNKPEHRRERTRIIDSAPIKALRNATAGISGGMTSKSRPWIRLALREDDLMKDDQVRQWLHDTTLAVLEAYQLSNFYTAITPWYRELLAFGMPGGMLELFDADTLLRFHTFTVGEGYYAVNEKGEIDTFYRRFPMTARNIVDRFGYDNVTKEIQGNADAADRQYKYHTVCQCIQPNGERNFAKQDNTNLPFESTYWLDQDISQTLQNAKIFGKSGFHEFPVFAPRWDTVSTQSIYGDGPGNDELGNCMMLQGLWEDYLRAVHMENAPPMRIPPNYTDKLSLLPNAQNIDPTLSKGGNGQGISKLFEMRFDYKGVFECILDVRNQIAEGFFNDLFRMLVDRPGMQPPTAYEIAKRYEEKIGLLSPVLDRTHVEGLVPNVTRTFGIMSRAGAIALPPKQIQGAQLKVEFISTLAQAQKLVGLQPIEMFVGFIGANAELFPNIKDKVDYDKMADEYAEVAGVTPKMIRDDKDVEQLRLQRAQQAEAQMGLDQMQQGAAIAKDASQAGPALEAIQGGIA